MGEQRAIVGIHIPKCAGTSLLNRVQSALETKHIFQNTSIIKNWQEGSPDFLYAKIPQLKFVWGHTIHEEMLKFFGARLIFITGLREPIDRFRSELRYSLRLARAQNRPAPDIEKQIRVASNPICRFIIRRFPTLAGESGSLADQAFRVISMCHYVYFSETFEETADAIFRLMNVRPEKLNSNEAPELSEDHLNIDVSNHFYDIELYRRAREKFANIILPDAFNTTSPVLIDFIRRPVRREVLRTFLWNSSYHEYANWGALSDALKQKKQQVEDLRSEIAHYEEMLSKATQQ